MQTMLPSSRTFRRTKPQCYYVTHSSPEQITVPLQHRFSIAAILTFCAAALGAFGNVNAASPTPRVIVSILPLHALASMVMQDIGEPHLLLRDGASPHSFQLRPSDTRALHNADLVFWVGPELETPLKRILASSGDIRAVALIDAPKLKRLPLSDAHDHKHGHHHDDQDAKQTDPHIWLDPANAIVMIDAIAAALREVDPANAVQYQRNAATATRRISALERAIAVQMNTPPAPYAVFHDAYRYFEDAFGVKRKAVVRLNPDQAPGAARLRAVRRTLVEDQVSCLFSEPQYPSRLIEAIGQDLGVRHAVLDPLGTNIPPGPAAYEQLLQRIADTLQSCKSTGPQR